MQLVKITVLLLSFTAAKCCFFSFKKTPPTIDAPSVDAYSAKSTTSRFYIEIEEGPNHTIINAIKKLPPIQSQTIDSNGILEESFLEPGSPSIESELLEGEESELLSPRDSEIRKDWNGSCDSKYWDVCSKMEEIHVKNVHNKTKNGKTELVHLELPCTNLNITCLANGWTVNRCQLICMSKCNKEILQKYVDYVKHDGPCQYT